MLNRLYTWYGKRVVFSVAIIIVLLIGVGIFFLVTKTTPSIPEVAKLTSVTVKEVKDLTSTYNFSTIGTVEAVSEANLQTESSGRITSVNVEIGQQVAAGTILATIENSAEQATLLQAEGSYDVALAQTRSGEVTIDSAETGLQFAEASAINAFNDAYVGVDDILHNRIDTFFTLNNNDQAIGFKLDGGAQTNVLNRERTAIEEMFNIWTMQKDTLTGSNINQNLEEMYTDTLRIAQFIEALTVTAQDQKISKTYTPEESASVIATMFALRTDISNILQEIDNARSALTAAQEKYTQAQISGSKNVSSVSSAQLKIALGSLRSAQANYEKTLVRTPISGTVNALYLKAGGYVSPNQPAAIIANNEGLQVSTYVSEEDSSIIHIGDTVQINDTSSGVVVAIAPALDPTNGKIEVKISISDASVINGSTVSITFTHDDTQLDEQQQIVIPLASLKMTASGPTAFKVSDDNTLTSIPVTIGAITGDSVEILSGLTTDTTIVTDARGLKDGQSVTITN
jgi:RND family efflux transporter MFP subunit